MTGTAKPGSMKPDAARLFEAVRELLGEASVRRGVASDAVCGVVPEVILEPADEADLSRVLRYANEAGLLVSPRGGGSKLEWGAAPEAIDLMVSTARLNRVLEYAPEDMTVTAGAGVSIAELQRTLAGHGQRLALDPLWPEQTTVGGVIATNDSGTLRLRYGSIRDLLIGITVVVADGTVAVSGGKVVKNVAGYDLPKLIAGSLGTLGIISRAVFRLHPLPESSQTLSWRFPDCKRANEFMLAIADSLTVPTGLQMCVSGIGGEARVDVRFDGIPAGITAQFEAVRKLAEKTEDSPEAEPWQAREQLWNTRSAQALIAKISTLPTRLSATADFIRCTLSEQSDWKLLMNSTGIGWLRIAAASDDGMAAFITALRAFLAEGAGTAVVLRAPAELRGRLDLWGDAGSALPLMRGIKQQFDRNAILNRGRFVGGI